jgi:hypothetical protein
MQQFDQLPPLTCHHLADHGDESLDHLLHPLGQVLVLLGLLHQLGLHVVKPERDSDNDVTDVADIEDEDDIMAPVLQLLEPQLVIPLPDLIVSQGRGVDWRKAESDLKSDRQSVS